MDKKLEKVTKNVFSNGSIRDAAVFLEMCVINAFPEFHFRGLEVTNLLANKNKVEGKSWNHILKVKFVELEDGKPAWRVTCHRVSEGETDDKSVLLDVEDLKPML